MIVKLSYAAKDLVMENIAKLKGKSNPNTGQVLFISEQIPEGVTSRSTEAGITACEEAQGSKRPEASNGKK